MGKFLDFALKAAIAYKAVMVKRAEMELLRENQQKERIMSIRNHTPPFVLERYQQLHRQMYIIEDHIRVSEYKGEDSDRNKLIVMKYKIQDLIYRLERRYHLNEAGYGMERLEYPRGTRQKRMWSNTPEEPYSTAGGLIVNQNQSNNSKRERFMNDINKEIEDLEAILRD